MTTHAHEKGGCLYLQQCVICSVEFASKDPRALTCSIKCKKERHRYTDRIYSKGKRMLGKGKLILGTVFNNDLKTIIFNGEPRIKARVFLKY